MKKSEFLLKGLIYALGVLVYTSAVAWILFNGESIFGKKNSFLMPVVLLLLFIISACITSLLVLGKPIQLYFDHRKKEAIVLLFCTLSWLIFFILSIVVFLALV